MQENRGSEHPKLQVWHELLPPTPPIGSKPEAVIVTADVHTHIWEEVHCSTVERTMMDNSNWAKATFSHDTPVQSLKHVEYM